VLTQNGIFLVQFKISSSAPLLEVEALSLFLPGCSNGISTRINLGTAVPLSEWSSDQSDGKGVPIDFTATAESFQKGADGDYPDGANGSGSCFEQGTGIDVDIQSLRSARQTTAIPTGQTSWVLSRALDHPLFQICRE
jgi:hypothetical protein